MKNWFSKFLADTNERGRNIFVIALITFGVIILSAPLYIYLAVQARAWQIYAMLGIIAAFMLASLYNAALARKNRTDSALAWILGGFYVIMPLLAAVIAGMGLVLAVAQTLGTFLIVGQTLKGPRATRAAMGGLAMAVITVLIDQFAPWERASYPLLSASIPYISGGAVLALGIYVLRGYRQYSLRTKLIGSFLLVTLIPLGATFLLNNRNTRQILTEDANTALSSLSATTADAVDGFLAEGLTDVRNAAQLHILEEYLALSPAERLGSETETVLYRDFRSIASHDPIYITSVGLIDARGKDIADTYSADIGLDKTDRTWFKAPVDSGLPYLSPLEFSEALGQYSLYFSAPVRNTDGKIIGVLRVRYNADILQKIVVNTSESANIPDSFIVLLDENHIRMGHSSDPDLVLKSVVPFSPEKLAQLQEARRLPMDKSAEELSTNIPELEAGINNVDNQSIFSADFVAGGEGLDQGAVVRLKNQPWFVVVAQPTDTFLVPVQQQTRAATLLALLIASLVAAAGFFVAQTLSAPIIRLTTIAEQVSAGNLQAQAKIESKDEIGTLAGAFNTMTAQLSEFISTLEQRVAERTRDLEIVAEVSTATATILEVKNLLQGVVDLTKERFNLYHTHIYLLDEAGENLVLASGAGEPGRQMVAQGRSIPLNREQSLVARAARERKGVTVNDVTQAPDFLPNPLLPDTRSELAVPMIVGGKVIGVFDVQSDVVGRFTDSDVNIQTTLAAQVATSIQNVRSFEQSKRQAEFESVVNAIGQKIQRSTSIEETLQTAIRELGMAVGASRVKAKISVQKDENNN